MWVRAALVDRCRFYPPIAGPNMRSTDLWVPCARRCCGRVGRCICRWCNCPRKILRNSMGRATGSSKNRNPLRPSSRDRRCRCRDAGNRQDATGDCRGAVGRQADIWRYGAARVHRPQTGLARARDAKIGAGGTGKPTRQWGKPCRLSRARGRLVQR